MSGWSTSSTTIFAARRVLPPDLIVPAQASAPRMKLTGPEASPPLERCSTEPRMLERLIPEPEPPRKIMPSLVFQSRIDSIVSSTLRMKQARALRVLLEADVEPDRAVEGGLLVQQDVGELGLEGVGVLVGGEVAALAAPAGDRAGDAGDHLLDRALALVGAEPAAEVLLGDDVGRVLRPARPGTRPRAARTRGSRGRRSRRREAPTRPRRRGGRRGSCGGARRSARPGPDSRRLQRFCAILYLLF